MEMEVDKSKQFFFVIRRTAPLTHMINVWQREAKKGKLKSRLMVHFAGENGVDDGALSKVFLTRAINEIGLKMFPGGFPIDSMLSVQNGDFITCGQICSYRLTH